ncbi:Ti-type conjugative transfer relaxase TraA [Martelella soudanensis]|uniref:Ti-type conjugative transfer relaxase TraA n=1 Tax=unclassified Martelella TaxID=2629616 RepID=UPI0015DF545E|nr:MULTISPECIES: Ti-type conjugative transfer relaxase TraA [unclassified Martelella]
MAIYHLRAHQISRGKGQSAVAAAAYRHATHMNVARSGEIADYSRKKGCIHSEVVLPEGAPRWIHAWHDRYSPHEFAERFWNRVEASEQRDDAQLAHEFVVALPVELSVEQNKALVRDFVRNQFAARGQVADWNYHDATGNPHVHIMVSLRPLTETGFGPKRVPVLDGDGEPVRRPPKVEGQKGEIVYRHFAGWKDRLPEIRAAWSQEVNRHLVEHGYDVTVDHRSFEDRDIPLEPTTHRGPAVDDMEARGIQTEMVQQHQQVMHENFRKLAEDPSLVLKMITAEKSVFDERDVAKLIHRYASTSEEFTGLFLRVGALENLVTLSQEIRDPFTNKLLEREKLTTREVLQMEASMIDGVRQRATDQSFGALPRHVDKAITDFSKSHGFSLSDEQAMVVHAVASDRGVSTVVGYAGAGKSTVMDVVRQVYEGQGRRVVGGALAGKAAEGLSESAGIESRTLASWRMSWEHDKRRLQKGDVFVLDEAGMVSSNDMAMLVDAVNAAQAKLILVGDARQLQPIQAGAAFRAIADNTGFVELTEVRRQSETWMRDASLAFGRGESRAALEAYADNGHIRLQGHRDDAMSELVGAWGADWRAGADTLMLAHTKDAVFSLNERARQTIKAHGGLQNEVSFDAVRGPRAFAVGDRLLFLENNRDLGVKNGMLATVEKTNDGILDVRLDNGRTVSVNHEHYNNVDYGYATTIHKSQGSTVDRVHVLATQMMDAQLSYVALSRHREAVTLYAGRNDFPETRDLLDTLSRDRLKDSTLAYEHTPDYQLERDAFVRRRDLPDIGELRGLWRRSLDAMRSRFSDVAERFRTISERLSLARPQAVEVSPNVPPAEGARPVEAESEIRLPELTPAVSQALSRLSEVDHNTKGYSGKRGRWFRAAETELTQMSSSVDLVMFNDQIAALVSPVEVRSLGRNPDEDKLQSLVAHLPPLAQTFIKENWQLVHVGQLAAADKNRVDVASVMVTERRDAGLEADYEKERARYRLPDEPLIPAVTQWSVSVEAVARDPANYAAVTKSLRQTALTNMGKVWRDPAPILDRLAAAVMSGGDVTQVLRAMDENPVSLGELHGKTSLLGRPDDERKAALAAVMPATSSADAFIGSLRVSIAGAEKLERKLRSQMAEPVGGLSPAARDVVASLSKASNLPEGSDERRALERAAIEDSEAVGQLRGLAREIRARFGDSSGVPDRDMIARAMPDLSPEERSGIYHDARQVCAAYDRCVEIDRTQRREIRLEHAKSQYHSIGR